MREVTSNPIFWIVAIAVIALIALDMRRSYNFRQYVRRRDYAMRFRWGVWYWSEDGWIRYAEGGKAAQYGGDDYAGGPDDGGDVEIRP